MSKCLSVCRSSWKNTCVWLKTWFSRKEDRVHVAYLSWWFLPCLCLIWCSLCISSKPLRTDTPPPFCSYLPHSVTFHRQNSILSSQTCLSGPRSPPSWEFCGHGWNPPAAAASHSHTLVFQPGLTRARLRKSLKRASACLSLSGRVALLCGNPGFLSPFMVW